MRTSTHLAVLALLLLVVAAAPALAEEPAPADPFPVTTALDAQLQTMPDSWQDRWNAYQDHKADLAAERETLVPHQEAWRKRKVEGEASLSETERALAGVWDAFIPVQTRIATALRRDLLSLGALLMGFFAATLLWGGFTVTVTIAIRSEKQKKEAAAS
jgi:hypothetical protein